MKWKICIFGSSSKLTPSVYVEESKKLGRLIAESGHICVNGAGRFGCMGGMNEGCKAAGGDIIGVIHERFCVDFENHPLIENLIRVKGADLTERKDKLFENSDCIIVMPGGAGTFDEFWEAVSCKVIGFKGLPGIPICVVNIDGFFDGSILQLQRASRDQLLYGDEEEYFHVENSVPAALTWCIQQMDIRAKESIGETVVDLDQDPLAPNPANGKFDRILLHSTTLGDGKAASTVAVSSSFDRIKSGTERVSSGSKSTSSDSSVSCYYYGMLVAACLTGFVLGRITK